MANVQSCVTITLWLSGESAGTTVRGLRFDQADFLEDTERCMKLKDPQGTIFATIQFNLRAKDWFCMDLEALS